MLKLTGTRFMRIRAKLAKARDEELDKGVITWSAVDVSSSKRDPAVLSS